LIERWCRSISAHSTTTRAAPSRSSIAREKPSRVGHFAAAEKIRLRRSPLELQWGELRKLETGNELLWGALRGGAAPRRSPSRTQSSIDANVDREKAETGSRSPRSGESVPMPPAGKGAPLGPAHSALHERRLHANLGGAAAEADRMRAPDGGTLATRPSPRIRRRRRGQ
jgi:hypothetical protein